jgi:hypothetical protein
VAEDSITLGVGIRERAMSRDGPFTGHAHFWERAMSRRQFVATSAAATGAALTSGLWLPVLAEAAPFNEADPMPIPTGTQLPFAPGPFRFFFPGPGNEVSTIGDFTGFVGGADVGQTTGTDGTGTSLFWKADVRFMQGKYVGAEGDTRKGTFAFV